MLAVDVEIVGEFTVGARIDLHLVGGRVGLFDEAAGGVEPPLDARRIVRAAAACGRDDREHGKAADCGGWSMHLGQ